jgi:hypothetical protein
VLHALVVRFGKGYRQVKLIFQLVLLVSVSQFLCQSVHPNPTWILQRETILLTEKDHIQMIQAMVTEESRQGFPTPQRNKVFIVTNGMKHYRLPKFRKIPLISVTADELKEIQKKNKITDYIDLTNTKIKDDSVILYFVHEFLDFKNGRKYSSSSGRIYEFKKKDSFWKVESIHYFLSDR